MVGVVGGRWKIPWIFPSQDTQLEAGNCKLSCVTDAERIGGAPLSAFLCVFLSLFDMTWGAHASACVG